MSSPKLEFFCWLADWLTIITTSSRDSGGETKKGREQQSLAQECVL